MTPEHLQHLRELILSLDHDRNHVMLSKATFEILIDMAINWAETQEEDMEDG